METNNNSPDKGLLIQIAKWAKNKFQNTTGVERVLYGIIFSFSVLVILFFFSSCGIDSTFVETSYQWNKTEQQFEIIIKPRLRK